MTFLFLALSRSWMLIAAVEIVSTYCHQQLDWQLMLVFWREKNGCESNNLCDFFKIILSLSIFSLKIANIMKELEKNLGMIEEVTGRIVIRMAHSLVSLNFFKRLKRIGGRNLEDGWVAHYRYLPNYHSSAIIVRFPDCKTVIIALIPSSKRNQPIFLQTSVLTCNCVWKKRIR